MSDVPEVYKIEGITRAALGPMILASRDNLLDNPELNINQRGQTTYSGTGGYCVDRWIRESNLTVEVVEGGVEVTGGGSINHYLYQIVKSTAGLLGQKVTLSVEVDGTIYTRTINVPVSIAGTIAAQSTSWGSFGLATASGMLAAFISLPSGSVVFSRAKLEKGEISTMEYDPPADYDLQMQICKRYFRMWTTSDARTEALKEVGLMRLASPTPVTINIGGTDYYAADANL